MLNIIVLVAEVILAYYLILAACLIVTWVVCAIGDFFWNLSE